LSEGGVPVEDPIEALLRLGAQSQPPAPEPAPPQQYEAPEDPLAAFLNADEGKVDDDFAQFDNQLREILKRGADIVDNLGVEDHIETLLQSGPRFETVSESEEPFAAPAFESDDSEGPSFPLPPMPFAMDDSVFLSEQTAPQLNDIMGADSLGGLESPLPEPTPQAMPPMPVPPPVPAAQVSPMPASLPMTPPLVPSMPVPPIPAQPLPTPLPPMPSPPAPVMPQSPPPVPPAPAGSAIPNLPPDNAARPGPAGNPPQDDFLRMFPRSKG
jgi:hypothetical protein